MGKQGEELTEQETAIYDRQIRVWGVDAQRRYYHKHMVVEDRCLLFVHVYEISILITNNITRIFISGIQKI